jgi:hypothetical protein
MRLPLVCHLVLLSVLLAGCGKLRLQTTITPQAIPAQMEGEWTGTWTSSTNGAQGTLHVRLQTFANNPVVRFENDHPVMQVSDFRFLFLGRHVEIHASDATAAAFSGDVAAGLRTMSGVYSCTGDAGTWQAAWNRVLPPIGDVSGDWLGGFETFEPPLQAPLHLQLVQTWVDGVLHVSGEIDVPGTSNQVAIQDGIVEWRETDYVILLTTDPAAPPTVLMQAAGTRSQFTVNGALQVDPGGGQAVVSAVWTATMVR